MASGSHDKTGIGRLRRVVGALVVVLAVASGCEPSNSAVVGTTESGVPWVGNSADGSWDEGEGWTARIAFELGVIEGSEVESFGSVRGVGVLSDSTIVVLDDMEQRVHAFGSSGQHLFSFGSRGQGPGEFLYADGLIIDASDNIWVFDARQNAYLQFSAKGDFVRQITGELGQLTYPQPAAILADGRIVGQRYQNPGRDYTVSMLTGATDVFEIVAVDPTSGEVTSFPEISYAVPTVDGVRVPRFGVSRVHPTATGDIWFSDPRDYRLTRRALSGDSSLVVSVEGVNRVEITAPERDSIARGLRERADQSEYGGRIPGASDIPSQDFVIQRILTDEQDQLYVFPQLAGEAKGRFVHIFTSGGELLGRVELPVIVDRIAPAVFFGGDLYVAVRGELDVPKVVRIEFAR